MATTATKKTPTTSKIALNWRNIRRQFDRRLTEYCAEQRITPSMAMDEGDFWPIFRTVVNAELTKRTAAGN